MAVADPETGDVYVFEDGAWRQRALHAAADAVETKELAL
jgi:hypothetical protein